MSRRSITIGEQTFKNQAELRAHIRKLFESHKQDVFTANQETHDFIMQLLPRHHMYASKISGGINHFRIERGRNSRSDWFDTIIVRPDNSEATLSMEACIVAGQKRPLTVDTKAAMRAAIVPDVIAFRDASNQQCATCKAKAYEVDHCGSKEFNQLAQDFINENGLCNDIGRTNTKWGFINTDYANKWIAFHREHATLQMLCRRCHSKKTYQKPHNKTLKVLQSHAWPDPFDKKLALQFIKQHGTTEAIQKDGRFLRCTDTDYIGKWKQFMDERPMIVL
jgi:hypothetical protein